MPRKPEEQHHTRVQTRTSATDGVYFVAGTHWIATCSCGWMSRPCYAEDTAEDEASAHVVAVVR
jgi:hypothetical protein